MSTLNEHQLVDGPQPNQNSEISVNHTLTSDHHTEAQMKEQDGNTLEDSVDESLIKINSQVGTSSETNKVSFVVSKDF